MTAFRFTWPGKSDLAHRQVQVIFLRGLALVWAGLVLGMYYRRAGSLFNLGLLEWGRDNPSIWIFLVGVRNLVSDWPAAWRLPYFQQAASGILTALWGAGLIFLAVQVIGIAIRRAFRWVLLDWREAFLFQSALGLGSLSLGLLLMAWAGFFRPVYVQGFIGIIGLAGGAWAIYSLVRGRKTDFALARSIGTLRGPDSWWAAILLLTLSIGLIGALAPEVEYDALWYHLWLPQQWLQQGHPVDLVQEYISLYPLHWELLYGAGLVMGGAGAAKLLSFACLPLGALLTFQMARRFTPGASAWLAAALFATTPIVLWEGTTAYVDLALAFFIGLSVYALLAYLELRTRQWLVLTAFLLGLSLAIKHLALLIWLPAVAGLALYLWWEGRTWRSLGPAAAIAGLSLLIPLPWYLRSYLASGNPFFPDLYSFFGAFPPERWTPAAERSLKAFKEHFGYPRRLIAYLRLPWDMTIHAARFGGTLGPLYLLLLPLLALGRRTQAVIWMSGLVLCYIILWASPLSSFQMRFLVPVVPILAVLGAAGFHWGVERVAGSQPVQRLASAILACMLLLNLPPFLSIHEGDRVKWDGWLTHVVHTVPIGVVFGQKDTRTYLREEVPSYRAWEYIDAHLPGNARVLTFSGGDQFYSRRERISSDAPLAEKATWGAPRGEEAEALEELRRLGVSYVLFDKRQIEQSQLDNLALAQPELMAEKFSREYEDQRFVLYRLR